MAALVDEARAVRAGLQAKAVLNCADPGDRSKDNSAAAVGELAQFEYLPTPLRRRKAFANAAGAGLSVLEITPPGGGQATFRGYCPALESPGERARVFQKAARKEAFETCLSFAA